jgi:hypothetical protein
MLQGFEQAGSEAVHECHTRKLLTYDLPDQGGDLTSRHSSSKDSRDTGADSLASSVPKGLGGSQLRDNLDITPDGYTS